MTSPVHILRLKTCQYGGNISEKKSGREDRLIFIGWPPATQSGPLYIARLLAAKKPKERRSSFGERDRYLWGANLSGEGEIRYLWGANLLRSKSVWREKIDSYFVAGLPCLRCCRSHIWLGNLPTCYPVAKQATQDTFWGKFIDLIHSDTAPIHVWVENASNCQVDILRGKFPTCHFDWAQLRAWVEGPGPSVRFGARLHCT